MVVIGWFVWLFAFAVHPRRSAPPPPAGDTVALLHDVLRQRGKPLLRSLRSSRLRPSTIPRWRMARKRSSFYYPPLAGWQQNEVPSTIPRWRRARKRSSFYYPPLAGVVPTKEGPGVDSSQHPHSPITARQKNFLPLFRLPAHMKPNRRNRVPVNTSIH